MTDRKVATQKSRRSLTASTLEALESRQMLSGWSQQDLQINLDKARANFPSITGAGETVAIIDQGVDTGNPDLAGRVVATWNFDNNTPDVFPYDNNAHGTGTAGQIAANPHTYNGQLYEGVAPGVKIVALKANGTWETKEAFDWILAHRAQYNIVAVNYLDFTGSVNQGQTMPEMKALSNAGVFMAGAVGNYGPGQAYGNLGHLIYTVGSVNSADQLSNFTPRGPNLDFVAPGQGVVISWYWNGKHMDYPSDGTSWAGPQVTATGALLKQINPGFSPGQIASIIHDSAHWVYDGYSKRSYAMLDVNAALALGIQRSGGKVANPTPTATPTPTPTATTTTHVATPTPTSTASGQKASSGLSGSTASKATTTAKNTPFTGKPFSAGQTILFADFDAGGEGISYHDTSAVNQGNSTYRGNTGVDVGHTTARGGVTYVGWTQPGEWLDYTVSAAKSGTYALEVRAASASGGGQYHLEVDGRNVSGEITVRKTGAWNAFTTTTIGGIPLTAGTHTIRVVMDKPGADGFVANFATFDFHQISATASFAARGSTAAIPSAPQNLSITSVSGTSLLLNWSDTSTSETGYLIERATSSDGTYSVVAVINASSNMRRHTGTRSYRDTGLKTGATYYYKVMSINPSGDSLAVTGSGTPRR